MALDLRFRPWRRIGPGNAHRSLWVDQALARESPAAPRALENEQHADVCIIGGGFTGLWTAHRLRDLDPALRIAVLEADACGTGASGRNSGGMSHWWSKLPTLLHLLGAEDAKRVLRASTAALDDIRAFLAEHRIECELRSVRSVWSATARTQVGAWNGMFSAAESLGLTPPHRVLAAEELRALFGKGPYLAGVIEEGATRVQPALLARGLRRAALERGVEIFEDSPVSRVAGEPGRLVVQAGRGRVYADKVVLAANAWMAHLPEFRSSIVVVSSDIVVTAPIPELLDRLGMRDRPGGVNSRQMLNYGGLTPDGRVYLGRGGGTLAFAARIGPAFDWSPRQAAEVEEDFRFLYPELREVPIERGWAGPVDRAPAGLPWFGTLREDERVHYAMGYSGHGVAASAIGGRILASSVLGRSDEWTSLARCFQRCRRGGYPPEPVRYLGGRMVRAAVARKEMAERQGRQPSLVDKALARLAPATITGRSPAVQH
ncbi:MAG: FAD-dependent oxidoreductase [Burkholderiales bacterium]|nr:FAD-dependent oxidoreductase [Burkholderiales bacterium]